MWFVYGRFAFNSLFLVFLFMYAYLDQDGLPHVSHHLHKATVRLPIYLNDLNYLITQSMDSELIWALSQRNIKNSIQHIYVCVHRMYTIVCQEKNTCRCSSFKVFTVIYSTRIFISCVWLFKIFIKIICRLFTNYSESFESQFSNRCIYESKIIHFNLSNMNL